MRRALVGAACFLTGCSLLVSVDGLSGGAPSAKEQDEGGSVKPVGDSQAPVASLDGGEMTTDGAGTPSTSRYAKEVLADKPSVYLRFGEAKGTPAVKNEVAPGYPATYPVDVDLGTPGAIAGDPDTAITFNGGILELPAGVECADASDCVVELWVRMEATQPDIAWILDHEIYDPRAGWLLQTQDGDITFERWSNDATAGAVYEIDKLSLQAWHHVVAVRDAQGLRMYVDGTLREHHPSTGPIPATSTKWTVGGNSCFDCATRFNFNGSVDELAVYEHTIGEERITAHYAAGLGK
jgi:hypothetical protein